MITNSNITLVTVVPSEEIGLLALQARSIAKFFEDGLIAQIIIIVNDMNETRSVREISDIVGNYGIHEKKVQVLCASDLFASPLTHLSPAQKFRKWLAETAITRVFRWSTGWYKHDGWSVQQALKLLSVKSVTTDFTVLLDCKNIFVRTALFEDFVANDGRTKIEISKLDRNHRRWLPASLRMFGTPKGLTDITEATQYVTPFALKTRLLHDVVNSLEQKHGNIVSIFVVRFLNAALWGIFNYTEFMLINGFIYSNSQSLNTHFYSQERNVIGFSARSNEDDATEFAGLCDEMNPLCVALHSVYLAKVSKEKLDTIRDVLIKRGLPLSDDELVKIANETAKKRASRVRKSHKIK